jgi:hypothetical protein
VFSHARQQLEVVSAHVMEAMHQGGIPDLIAQDEGHLPELLEGLLGSRNLSLVGVRL